MMLLLQAKIDKTRQKKQKARFQLAQLEEEFTRVRRQFQDKCEELRL